MWTGKKFLEESSKRDKEKQTLQVDIDNQTFPGVSYDEILEIMAKMPSRAVGRIKTASKELYQRASENHFLTRHTEYSKARGDVGFFIAPDTLQYDEEGLSWYPLPNTDNDSRIHKDMTTHISRHHRVLATDNGIILCRGVKSRCQEIKLWNPLTGNFQDIPPPSHLKSDSNWHMALEFTSGRFKILKINTHTRMDHFCYSCELFSSESFCWKKGQDILTKGKDLQLETLPVLRGKAHFIAKPDFRKNSRRSQLLAYDLSTTETTVLRAPVAAITSTSHWGYYNSISKNALVPEGSLTLVKCEENTFSIWNLLDYEKSDWIFVAQVCLSLRIECFMALRHTVINGKVLILTTGKLVQYFNLETNGPLVTIAQHTALSGTIIFPFADTLYHCSVPSEERNYEICAISEDVHLSRDLNKLPGIIRSCEPTEVLNNWKSIQLPLSPSED